MDEDESVFTESLHPSDDPSSREAGALNDDGEEVAEESSFCGSTFSLYAPWVRGLYTLSCALIVATTFAHSYAYYFARDHPLLLASLHLSHLVYAVVVLFRLRTSYIESGLEETGRAAVARRYHRSPAMLADMVSFLPTGEIAWLASPHHSSPAWWRHQRWTPLIYLRVHFVMGYLMEREREPGTRTIKYRTLRYSIVVFLALHLITCWWFGLACAPDLATVALRFRLACSRSSWLGGFQSRVEQRILALVAAAANTTTTGDAIVTSARVNASGYASSLYWATATLTSTGYGDVRAGSETEKMFAVGAMLTSIVIVFGTVLGGMTSMLSNLDAKRSGFAHRRAAFYHEVARMEVSGEARDICLGYFEYAWRRWRGSSVHTDGTLRALPEALRAKFCEAAFAPFIGEVDLLRGLGEDFLRNLTLIVELSVFVDGQYVQRSGEIGDALCYVHRGVLEVLDGRDERASVALLHAGKAFGQIHLVYDLPRTSSVRCKVDSTLFLIRRHRFRQLLSDYPREARIFWQRVSDKGSGQRARWPLHPPPLLHFLSHLTEMRASDRRASIMPGAHVAATVHQSATSKQDEALLQVRRKSTVSSSRYEGARLVRVDLGGHDAPLGGGLEPHDSTLSYINLLHRNTLGESGDEHGTKRTARRSSVPIGDHIEIFSDFNQREPLRADESAKSDSAYDRFLAMTAVDPQGGFLRAWRSFMAAMTMFAFMHVTFVAFFMTSPAPGVTLKNDEVRGVDVYRIAVDSACDVTSATIYEEKCGEERDDFDRLVVCLIGTGRHINFLLSRRELGKYELKIPSSYDVSSVAMTTATPAGRANVALAYLLIDVVLWANMFVHFRISVVTPLNTFIDVRSASEAYTKLWGGFWLDLASLLPLEVITPLVSCSRYSRAVTWSFLRLNRAAAALRHVPAALADEERRHAGRVGLVRAVKFALYIYACTHLCACALYWSACGFVTLDSVEQRATKCEPGSWGWSYDITWRTGKLSDYVKSVYWITTTQTTTGYGDIVPSTTTERVLVIVTMLVGSVLYGWLVAVIACTVSNKLFERSVFQQKVLATEQYLAAQRVDPDLIARVVAVRRLEWKRYRGEASPGGEVIGSDLPQEMRDMLQCESVARYLRAVPFFRHASDSLVLSLCRHAHTYLFNAGDVVCYEDDVQTDLYMVRRGHCSSLDRQMRYVGRDYDPRDYFGAVEVFLDVAAPATVVATTTCELIALSRQSILGVLGDFPFYRDQLAAMARDQEYREAALTRARGGDRYDGDGTRNVGSMHDKFEVHSVNETL
ncbi:MAG: cyclic nucleotide-binding domain-containing protein, partial [Planctomycetota bacterium]